MAELEKRLAELEMAVGSGSDKQVHADTHTPIYSSPVLLSFTFIFVYLGLSFTHSSRIFMLPLLCNHQFTDSGLVFHSIM